MNEVTNKHIEPDPNLMEKVPAQMMIYDGSKWLEISNQQTINALNDTTVDLQQEAKEVKTYVDNVDSDFKKAQKNIAERITIESTKLSDSIESAKLDTKSVDDRVTQINNDNQQILSTIRANLSAIDKNLDSLANDSQKSIEGLQKQADDIKLSVADQLNQKGIEIQTAKQQAITNANQALKEYQTQVQTQFNNVDGKISQTVHKTDYAQLSKLVTATETRSIQNQNAIELKANKTSVDVANTKITDLESSLSVANDAIKARAKQTDVDKLADRVSSTEASLTVNANNISLKADKASIDNLSQQVNTINSAMLTVNSDQIKSLVNSTNANSGQIAVLSTQTQQNKDTIKTLATKTDLDLLTNTVNQAKSEWTQSSNGIKASVSAVGSKLANLSFGGRNLLKQSQLGSNYKHNAWYETFGGVTWNSDTVELNVGDKDCVQIEQRVYNIEPDTNYVFSFDLNYADGQHLDRQGFIFWEFKDRDCKQTTSVYTDNWTNMTHLPNTPGRRDKKIVIHTQPDTHTIIFMVRSLKGAKLPFRLSKVKFEKGNTPTDWSPAPDDINEQLSAVNNTLQLYNTEFNLLKDGMTLRINEIIKVNDRINELKVGGRNYLQGSLDFTWPTGIGRVNVTPTFEMQGGTKVAHLNSRDFGGIYTKWGGAFPNGELQVGDDYTLSFDARGTGVFKIVKNESEVGDGTLSGTSLTSDWKRYSVSGKINSLNKAYVIYFIGGYDAYIRHVKIEKGNKATDYTQAPEDINSQINSVNNTLKTYKTDFDLLKDGMSLRVAEISKINDRFNNLTIGGTNLLDRTSEDPRSNDAPRTGWVEGAVYNTLEALAENQYVLSFEARGDVNGQRIGTFLWNGGLGGRNISKRSTTSQDKTFTASDGQSFVTLTTQWQRYWVRYEVDPDNTRKAVIVGRRWADSKPNGKVYVRKVKLESGNKATDWSPAPKDIENKINGVDAKYASLDVKVNNINSIVATKSDKSYIDQKAAEINSVVANKANISYVDQRANQWQLALQNVQRGINNQLGELSGKITATSRDLSTLYSSDTYRGMQKIVQNSAFLQNANGFTTQVQQLVGDELKQVNLVYNSEFEPGNGQEIEGWTTNYQIRRGTNMWDNYYGSTTLGMWTFNNANDQWVNAWSQMIDVNEGDHLSASVIAFYTGPVQSTPLGGCGIEIELFENESTGRKLWTGNYEGIANIPYQHDRTIRVDDYTIPKGITKARVGLVIKGKGNVMFAHPMLVKGKRVGIYQPSVINKLSKLTQTLDGLKSEVHDSSINSVIGQTARMIALQISGDKNKIISQINASTEGVMIDGKHVLINGNTRIQGTLMVNDVVMRSQNNAVKFSPSSLDMVGANSMLKLQNDSIHLGSTSSDPRHQWGMKLSDDGLELSVPAKKLGATTNNPSDYNHEIQGYIKGGGWDYRKMDTVGNGASGIEMGLMTKQIWGAPYGGDYIAIGQYVPSSSGGKILQPAISYSETGFGWAPKDIHVYKPMYFGDEVHFGAGSAQNGIRTAWVSWSDWNSEKYPCFVNDGGNWGGIAFPRNGNVILFNNAGKRYNIYETENNKVYNNYGGY